MSLVNCGIDFYFALSTAVREKTENSRLKAIFRPRIMNSCLNNKYFFLSNEQLNERISL